MPRDALREEEVESLFEAAPAVVLIIGIQAALAAVSNAQDWVTWQFHWWIWLVPVGPEVVLLALLTSHRPRRKLEEIGIRREVSLAVLLLVSLANTLLVVVVLGSLVEGQERSGAQLLAKAMCVWSTNVITFGICYWALDRGGPVRRRRPSPPPPDFQFPQMENPELVPRGWQPELLDYVYVSFTNSIAFSPTDAMPLSHRAKLLMLAESALSAVTILLVTARAVNIFK